jgi:prevent-host-death family protein
MARTVKASDLRIKFFALLDEVERMETKLVITKRGRPVADLVPHKPKKQSKVKKKGKLFGCLKGRIEILGDIISPIDVEWEALK